METKEDRIAQRAYALWEKEGFPEGRHLEHWQQAVDEYAGDGEPLIPEDVSGEAAPALTPVESPNIAEGTLADGEQPTAAKIRRVR